MNSARRIYGNKKNSQILVQYSKSQINNQDLNVSNNNLIPKFTIISQKDNKKQSSFFLSRVDRNLYQTLNLQSSQLGPGQYNVTLPLIKPNFQTIMKNNNTVIVKFNRSNQSCVFKSKKERFNYIEQIKKTKQINNKQQNIMLNDEHKNMFVSIKKQNKQKSREQLLNVNPYQNKFQKNKYVKKYDQQQKLIQFQSNIDNFKKINQRNIEILQTQNQNDDYYSDSYLQNRKSIQIKNQQQTELNNLKNEEQQLQKIQKKLNQYKQKKSISPKKLKQALLKSEYKKKQLQSKKSVNKTTLQMLQSMNHQNYSYFQSKINQKLQFSRRLHNKQLDIPQQKINRYNCGESNINNLKATQWSKYKQKQRKSFDEFVKNSQDIPGPGTYKVKDLKQINYDRFKVQSWQFTSTTQRKPFKTLQKQYSLKGTSESSKDKQSLLNQKKYIRLKANSTLLVPHQNHLYDSLQNQQKDLKRKYLSKKRSKSNINRNEWNKNKDKKEYELNLQNLFIN